MPHESKETRAEDMTSSRDDYTERRIDGITVKPDVEVPFFEHEDGTSAACFLQPGMDVNISLEDGSEAYLVNETDVIQVVVQQGYGYILAPLGDVFMAQSSAEVVDDVNPEWYFT